MPTERQILDTVALCVKIMTRHHDAYQSPESDEFMVAEVHMLVGWIMEMALEPAQENERILTPVRSELIDRFGPEIGFRLYVKFLNAYDDISRIESDSDNTTEDTFPRFLS